MKPKTFLLSLLALPYLLFAIAIPVSISRPSYVEGIPVLSFIYPIIFIASLVFAPSVVFWGVPYTVFVIGFLVWSRNKSAKRIYRALFFSPLLLAALIVVGLLSWLSFPTISHMRLPLLEDWLNLAWYSFLATILTLVFGYLFVGLGLVMYIILKHLRVIKSDTDHFDIKTLFT